MSDLLLAYYYNVIKHIDIKEHFVMSTLLSQTQWVRGHHKRYYGQ
jgi:hypothetical protein